MIPCIPPSLGKCKFAADFHLKSDVFSSNFAKQCSPIKNNCRMPLELLVATEKMLNCGKFSEDYILIVIRELFLIKAHGYDKTSIRMLKFCNKTICKPLHMIYTLFLENRVFLWIWKIRDLVVIHKKASNCKELQTHFNTANLR